MTSIYTRIIMEGVLAVFIALVEQMALKVQVANLRQRWRQDA